MKLPNIDVDFQVFLADGGQAIGTVRRVTPLGRPELDIYVGKRGRLRRSAQRRDRRAREQGHRRRKKDR